MVVCVLGIATSVMPPSVLADGYVLVFGGLCAKPTCETLCLLFGLCDPVRHRYISTHRNVVSLDVVLSEHGCGVCHVPPHNEPDLDPESIPDNQK